MITGISDAWLKEAKGWLADIDIDASSATPSLVVMLIAKNYDGGAARFSEDIAPLLPYKQEGTS